MRKACLVIVFFEDEIRGPGTKECGGPGKLEMARRHMFP